MALGIGTAGPSPSIASELCERRAGTRLLAVRSGKLDGRGGTLEAQDTRAAAKRDRILACAMRLFAEQGYRGARIEDIAMGSIFQHFGSKATLFLEAYKRAVLSLPAWLDAPADTLEEGFFATVDYWLERTEHLIREDRVPYRVALVGNYGTDLTVRREINRFLLSEDPYGTLEFVEWGQARGEVRTDVEAEVLASMIDWLSSSLQDALVTEELDPGLFHRLHGDPDRRRARLAQFAELLRSAVAAPASS